MVDIFQLLLLLLFFLFLFSFLLPRSKTIGMTMSGITGRQATESQAVACVKTLSGIMTLSGINRFYAT